MNIGIFGLGVVGTAVFNGFVRNNTVYRFDINNQYNTAEETVQNSDIIFVCVPTPNIVITRNRKEQDLSYVTKAIETIEEYSTTKKIIVIKSTVLPGTTRAFSRRFQVDNFIFNPEFLTARTANEDFLNQKQIVLGGEKLDEVEQLYKDSFPNTKIEKVSWETAELLKYTCNTFYATKVAFVNQIYNVCSELGISYETIKELFIANGWVSPMHLEVPGHDGKRQFGGACLPKDTIAFVRWAEERGISMPVLRGALHMNKLLREEQGIIDE